MFRGRWGSSKEMSHLRWASGSRWDSTPGGGLGWLVLGGGGGGCRGVHIPSQERRAKLVNIGKVSLGPTMFLPVWPLLHPNLPLGMALVQSLHIVGGFSDFWESEGLFRT